MKNIASRFFTLLLIILLLTGSFGPRTSAARNPFTRTQSALVDLALSNPTQTVHVIVQKAVESREAEAQVAALGGRVTSDLSIIHGFAAELTAESAVELARNVTVRWISLDAPVVSTACTG